MSEGPNYFEHQNFQKAYDFCLRGEAAKKHTGAMKVQLDRKLEYEQLVQQYQLVVSKYWLGIKNDASTPWFIA